MIEMVSFPFLDLIDLDISKYRINTRTKKLQDCKDDSSYLLHGAIMLKGIDPELVPVTADFSLYEREKSSHLLKSL